MNIRGLVFSLLCACACPVVLHAQESPEAVIPEQTALERIGGAPRTVSGRVYSPQLNAGFETSLWSLPSALPLLRASCTADAGGDRREDIFGITDTGELWLWTAGQANTFTPQRIAEAPAGIAYGMLTCGQFDADSLADVFVGSAGAWFIGFNQGGNRFVFHPVSFSGMTQDVRDVAAGNFTGDARDELVFVEQNRVSVLQNTGQRFEPVGSRVTLTTALFAGLLDIQGDGISEIAVCREYDQVCAVGGLQDTIKPETPAWAAFPRAMKPYLRTTGDFNGDGRGDMLIEDKWPYGTWIAFSAPFFSIQNGLEQEVRQFWSQPLHDLSNQRIIAGDFDGNGIDELALLTPGGTSVEVAASRFAAPLAGAKVVIQGQETFTAEDGSFELHGVRGEKLTAEISAAGYRTKDAKLEQTLFVRPGRTAAAELFPDPAAAAARGEPPPEFVGQAVSLGPDVSGPYVCTGYNPGSVRKWGDPYLRCPPQFAMYGGTEMPRRVRSPRLARTIPVCCRLPYDDILTSEEIVVDHQCPENYIAIGTEDWDNTPSKIHYMRCAKINTKRYTLGDVTDGKYHGSGLNMRRYWGASYLQNVPLGIRPGLTRNYLQGFELDGCHGFPFGSLLVRKGKRCFDQGYRQLLFTGDGKDPPQTPVVMFPDCAAIDNHFSPTAGCRLAPK